MTHFRGLLIAGVWQPICSTKDDPKSGRVTTTARDVDCPTCRRIIGMTGTMVPWDQRPARATAEEEAAETERRTG